MSEITSITPQVKDKTRCNIFVDGRFCCGMKLEVVVKNRLKVGQTVSAEELSKLQLESEKRVALDKALTHISSSAKTEKQIAEYLAGKGYLPAVVDYVLEKMRGYDFVNDAAYAKKYVEEKSKSKGKLLLKMELRGKGVSEADAERALLGVDGEDQLAAASRILEKYLRGKELDTATLQKGYRYLLSKGFDYDVAKSALGKIKEADE
ncbi:MAG: RecX family transcriptional regulator [Clostridia bacterium]|nr:RecX family transcriptional regulator [Clostridia bacterium]